MKKKLVVKIGNVYRSGAFENGTYFEEDERFETETESIETAQRELEKQFNVYHIYESNAKIIACVY